MIIPKKNRIAIYSYLFKEGVIVAEKNGALKHHPQLPECSNLEVMYLMRGFTTRKLVKETYAWRHNYYYLTNEGIEFLREQLHLPAQIIPTTLKQTQRTARPIAPVQRREAAPRRERPTVDAEGKSIPPAEFKPEFQRGAPRGRGFAGAREGAEGPRQGGRGYRQ